MSETSTQDTDVVHESNQFLLTVRRVVIQRKRLWIRLSGFVFSEELVDDSPHRGELPNVLTESLGELNIKNRRNDSEETIPRRHSHLWREERFVGLLGTRRTGKKKETGSESCATYAEGLLSSHSGNHVEQ